MSVLRLSFDADVAVLDHLDPAFVVFPRAFRESLRGAAGGSHALLIEPAFDVPVIEYAIDRGVRRSAIDSGVPLGTQTPYQTTVS